MKIFVVVGSLFPFDRLIEAIDNWASERTDIDITAQIGYANYLPKYMKYFRKLSAKDFNHLFSTSDLIISHAGMGAVIKALTENKPILILPRLLKFKEHTTDHQMATAKSLRKLNYVNVAMDIDELLKYLDKPDEIRPIYSIGKYAPQKLIHNLRSYIGKIYT